MNSLKFRDQNTLSAPAPVLVPVQQHASRRAQVLLKHEGRYRQLREANERLLLSALRAQELQAAAEQSLHKQKDFLAVLAHELRNPLTPLTNAAALLSLVGIEGLPAVQALIERQVAHLSHLVGDLLDVSRVNTGKLRLDCRVVDVLGIIKQVTDSYRPAMQARQQHFDMQMPLGMLEVYGDPVRFAQIFNNVVDNASKYTPNGGSIGLSVEVIDNTLVATLTDNGVGITAEVLPHIFEPFVQDVHAVGFNGMGLGIGLAVVHELVEAHGGTIAANSAGSALGSQFVIKLPLAEQALHA
jgi:signal transduction histidine kinase